MHVSQYRASLSNGGSTLHLLHVTSVCHDLRYFIFGLDFFLPIMLHRTTVLFYLDMYYNNEYCY